MSIKIIHTADWHIGKSFGRFDQEKAAVLRDARARVVTTIGGLARDRGACAVLVGGDIFDSTGLGDALLRKLAARLEEFDDFEWHFLPGNHDPSQSGGIWRRFEAFVRGGHVKIHHTADVVRIGENIDLLTAPLHARAITHDATAWMDDHQSGKGIIRVGLAHGSIRGFGGDHDAAVLIDPERPARAALDYLALGDWHGCKQVGERSWYSGTPEPEQFSDNEPGHALCVELAPGGGLPKVERVATGVFHWMRRTVRGADQRRFDELETELRATPGGPNQALIKLVGEGAVTFGEQVALREGIRRLEAMAFHGEFDIGAMSVTVPAATDALLEDPMLNAVGQRLARMHGEGDGQQRAIAREALLLLAEYSQGQGA